MVFEQIFKERWIEKKPPHAFLLGVVYSIIGILSARLIFGGDVGLMSVAFTSILLIPSLNQLLQHEENVEIREKKLSLRILFRDHRDVFEIYLFMFFGIFLVYSMAALMMSPSDTQAFFAPHLRATNLHGSAIYSGEFQSLLLNNFLVLMVCFILSLVYGAGSIIFITWNASVWGIFFGYVAKISSASINQEPLAQFLLILLPVMPHMITEAVSYFSASIVGGVVSKAMLREKIGSKKFRHVLTDALIFMGLGIILVIVAAAIEVYVFPLLP